MRGNLNQELRFFEKKFRLRIFLTDTIKLDLGGNLQNSCVITGRIVDDGRLFYIMRLSERDISVDQTVASFDYWKRQVKIKE